ncbi:hypothetical protein T03_14816 [Trichinella britovi]|uniref:Uncharacterized protein n=1 Tax=Trichinella britovi TaxID=45882 RepID=A0A0V1AKG4_TRIBR|nr:hypothetical protein T03_14816 [Trichinella britovi]
MNVPKRNFCGRKPLLLEILVQGFQLNRHPNIYDFETSSRPTYRSTAWQKWKKQPCTRVLGKLPGKVVIRAISTSQTNYAGSSSKPSSFALEWSS